MVIIPLRQIPNFSQEITIDNTPYRLTFKWNVRFRFWTMDILKVSGEVILKGIKLVEGYPLTRFTFREGLPSGDFFLRSQDGSRPEFDNFGTDVKLFFFSQEELDAI